MSAIQLEAFVSQLLTMPDVVFKNDADHAIHIGVWSVWLHCYSNSISPGDRWTAHLASIPYTIEIRAGDESTHFHEGTSGEAIGKMVNACGQGTASVLTAVGWGLGILGVGGSAARATSGYFTKPAFETVRGTMDAAIKGELPRFRPDKQSLHECYIGRRGQLLQ